MKAQGLENMCNRWEQTFTDEENKNFILSYKFTKSLSDYDDPEFEDDDILYLQNSGSMDIVWVQKYYSKWDQLTNVDGYPNIYMWIKSECDDRIKCIFALHSEKGILSDSNISNKIDNIQEDCHIYFTECIEDA